LRGDKRNKKSLQKRKNILKQLIKLQFFISVTAYNFNLLSGIAQHYAIIFLRDIILSIDMQNGIAPSVVLSSVVAPLEH